MILKKSILFKVLPVVAVFGIVTYTGWWVYNEGINKGFVEAERQYQEELVTAIEERDVQWQSRVDQLQTTILLHQIRQERDFERQQELLSTIRSLNTSLEEVQRDVFTSDLGSCTVSPDFDRVLNNAASTATALPRPSN